MKKFAIILLCMFPLTANAEWVEYKTMENGDVYFFDNSRVNVEGAIVRVLNRTRYQTSLMGAESHESELKINCNDRTHAIVRNTFYNDKDWKTPAMAPDNIERPPAMIKPGSAIASLAHILCN